MGTYTPSEKFVEGVTSRVLGNILRRYRQSNGKGERNLAFICPNGKWAHLQKLENWEFEREVAELRKINYPYRYCLGGTVYSSDYTNLKGESLPYKLIP